MNFLDVTLPTLAENLALDEAQVRDVLQWPRERSFRMAHQAFTYTVVYERDPETGHICASVPALDLASHGRDLADARAMIREALELHLEGLMEEHMAIPPDVMQIEQITVEAATAAPEEAAS